MYRVGIISFYHESNTFAEGRTTLDDFFNRRYLVGAAAWKGIDWGNHEIGGFLEGLDRHGIEPVPMFAAATTPGPVIAADAFEAMRADLMAALRSAGQVDGMLLAPHGAAVSESHPDADGEWVSAVRAFLGDTIPIIATHDPHANVSARIVASIDAIIAYRTNPHLDQRDRGHEAADLMARTLRGEVRPVQAAVHLPLVINIERQHTAESPCRDLQRAVRSIAGRTGVLAASLVFGFPYADVEEMGTSVIVVTDGDRSMAQRFADELAAGVLERREDLRGVLISPADAIAMASGSAKPVCLLDMGDNVGGGAPGDGTALLRLLDRMRIKSFVCLHDPAAVRTAFAAGHGQRVCLEIGGRSGPAYGPPLAAAGVVRWLGDGRFHDPRPRHGGAVQYDNGNTAVIELDSGVTVMLTMRRAFPASLNQLTSCGLDPKSFDVIVAKGVHAPVAAYEEVCPTLIRVNTPGITSADMSAFQYRRCRHAMNDQG